MKKQLIILSALLISFASQCAMEMPDKNDTEAMNAYVTALFSGAKPIKKPSLFDRAKSFTTNKVLPAVKSAVNSPAGQKALAIGQEKVTQIMKEPAGKVMDQLKKVGTQEALKVGVSQGAIDKTTASAVKVFESVFGAKEEDDSAQQEWVADMYKKQAEATTEEERAIYTKKLQDFFAGEQGQAFAVRHQD